jgi:RsiW-degrading membrane proteinase PrsW (M82 family)
MRRKVLAALAVVVAMVLFAALGPRGFMVGLVTALVPVPVYVAMALWLDRNEPEPGGLLARSFLWGMLVASLFAIVMNTAAVAFVQFTLGLSAIVGHRVATLLASPVFEELIKGLALLIVFRKHREEFDDVVDGAMYAAMVGLGFAATENVLYYGNAALHGHLAAVFATRGVASPFAHPFFTAMTGIGLGLARDIPDRRARIARIAAGLGAAITLHFLWNAAAAAHMLLYAYILIMAPTFMALLLLLRRSLAHERKMMRSRVAAETEAVALTEADIDVLCGVSREGTWRRHIPGNGPTRRQARALYDARRAAIELAFACWHAECAAQPDSPRVAKLRQNYIRACNEWRAHFTTQDKT